MQIITTKYMGPTNTRGSRIKASSSHYSITRAYNGSLKSEENHKLAVIDLMAKLEWAGVMYGGHTKDGMVFVFQDEDTRIQMEK